MYSEEKKKVQSRQMASLDHALGPVKEMLLDDRVIEIMLNPDGVLWVERVGEGMTRIEQPIDPATAERMIRLIATLFDREVNESTPSLAGVSHDTMRAFKRWYRRLLHDLHLLSVSPAPLFLP